MTVDPRVARRIKNESVANVARAFTNPVRLELLRVLNQGPASVSTLASRTGQSPANASAQLKVLLAANAVVARRQGRSVFYEIAGPRVRDLWNALQDLAVEAEPEFRDLNAHWFQVLAAPDPELHEGRLPPHGHVLDVRPSDEFAHGHLPGARNIPVAELLKQLSTLPPDGPFWVVGRDRFCVEAASATRILRDAGRDAYMVRPRHALHQRIEREI